MFKHVKFVVFFLVLLTLELICSSFLALNDFRYVTKPLLLTALIVFFRSNATHLNKSTVTLTFLALVFSLLGDVFLLFQERSHLFFILGLLAFLIAHILYVLVFSKTSSSLLNARYVLIALVAYALLLFNLLKDNLNEMLIPVIAYMLVILSMATYAYLRKGQVSSQSFVLVFAGALLFLISDSILALNKFYKPMPLANLSIMLTYGLAQLLIVLGILQQGEHLNQNKK